MRAYLGDAAVGDGDDAAGRTDGAQAVGDDQCGPSLGEVVEGPLDLGLRYGVQGGGCLVQNQDGGVHQEYPGDGHPLLLSTGQEGPTLAYIGLETVGHSLDIVVNFCPSGGLHDLLVGSAGTAIADILQDGIRKEKYVLLNNADGLVEALLGDASHIQAVNRDAAAGDIVKPEDQLAQGALAAVY